MGNFMFVACYPFSPNNKKPYLYIHKTLKNIQKKVLHQYVSNRPQDSRVSTPVTVLIKMWLRRNLVAPKDTYCPPKPSDTNI